jgi:hypothetical protein
LGAAGCIKKGEDQLSGTADDHRTRVAKCIDSGGGIMGNLLQNVTELSFLQNKQVTYLHKSMEQNPS